MALANEKIQNLAEEAGLYFRLENGYQYPKSLSAEACEAAYAKFAELIVKTVDDYLRTTDFNDLNCDNNTAVGIAADDILEMFGVVNES